jgi:hypothetical protein
LTTEGWMVVVCFHSNVGADGCEESNTRLRGLRVPVYGCVRRSRNRDETYIACVSYHEFEIKRNKAHGGCLGIERR